MKKLLLIFSCLILSFSLYPVSLREKVDDLEKKATEGDVVAMYHLSTLYEHGFDSIPADTLRSLHLLRRSAEGGYAPAQNYLGFRYALSDKDSAIYWLSRAAEGGEMKAVSNLAFLLLRPDSLLSESQKEENERKAADLLKKAASGGLPQGAAMLADLYREGRGVEKDTLQATVLYLEAISGGLRDVEPELLVMNHDRYLTLDPEQALSEGLRAARAGAHTVAFMLYNRAAEGDIPKAFALLGDAYSSAKGSDYNHENSLKNYLRAAQLGDPSAQFILAELLEIFPDAIRGLGEAGDIPSTPDYWYERAAESGITTAQEAIAHLFRID
ncbi:MAG: sel1 repeat family protein [Muribaculaceae bacterium]|nr:sel1 repeat family protein [Muribaculaceae bacterium]